MGHTWMLSAVCLMATSASIICGGVAVSRTEHFEEGEDVDLRCNNRTWSNTLHHIWKINISGVNCLISEAASKPRHNNCTGEKTLRNTAKGESYLYIPHFGIKDEGTYKCEEVYVGGAETDTITVFARVRPVLSTRLEHYDGQRFAVCSAARGKPEATVSWEEEWGSPEVTEKSTNNTDGTVTVESWLLLPDDITQGNLTCVASHASWTHNEFPILELSNRTDFITIVVISCAVLLIVVTAVVFSYAARKPLCKLR
ncbi:nectin-3-like isoform X2 [Clupea harengus]|uniref:Nectin-3-like isoform X2 n=1 Tax=Clupea harengus TaxID=7950 RepID=A0A8M1K5I8_CLUHA|nr:nectin-3-like isoform X2 [Clupea harengus]